MELDTTVAEFLYTLVQVELGAVAVHTQVVDHADILGKVKIGTGY